VKPFSRNIFVGKYVLLVLSVLLFTLSFIFNKLYTNRSTVSQEVKKVERYIVKQKEDFERQVTDTLLINQLLSREESLNESTALINKPYGLFLYKEREFSPPEMAFWSEQLVAPPYEVLNAADGEYFLKLANGYYYIIRKTLGQSTRRNTIVAYAMVLVQSEYFITIKHLQRKFAYSKNADEKVRISADKTDFPVKSPSGITLFYLDKKSTRSVAYNDNLTIILRLGALLFLFLFIHSLAESVAWRKGPWRGIALLSFLLLLLRVLMYYFPGLLNLRQFELFDPAIYGSNGILRSLGDLLLNAILFCWIILFSWSKLHKQPDLTRDFSPITKTITGIVALLLLILSTFYLATVIRSLVADSKISFDVTDFFSLTRSTVVGFVVLAFLSLSYYYFSQLLFRLIFPLFEGRKYLIYFAIGFAGLLYLTTRDGRPEVIFYIPVLLWLLVYTWLINRQDAIFNKLQVNIASILSWIFVFSISISVIMLNEIEKAEWVKRKKLAEKLAMQTDPSSEKMLSIALQYLDNRFLSGNFYRFRDSANGKHIRDSILAGSTYLDKYDTRLYVYDTLGRGLNNDDVASYEELNAIMKVQAKPIAGIEGLYYYNTGIDKFNYIIRRDVSDSSGHTMGFFFMVSNPKNYSREAIFPELFRQLGTDDETSPIYSNATYVERRLVTPPGNYSFRTFLLPEEVPKVEYSQRRNGEFDELWYKASNERVIVVARKRETLIETITLFSYIFCSFLLLVAFVQLISFALRSIYDGKSFRGHFELNIRSQVHSTIIFISVFSFLVIGAATISFFISRYHKSNGDKLSRTMKIMVNEMEKKLSDHSTFDDVVQIYDSVSNKTLQDLVEEVSGIHGVDVNVYDLKGDLQVASNPLVYNKGVLSRKIDPAAFFHLNRLRQVIWSHEEKVGNFSYLSIYSPVRDEKGKFYAYINIPYFLSRQELDQEISNFLVTIINLNAFIFLVAGLIALLITNRITRSFAVITDKMKEVNLGKKNEEIVWNKKDEIGDLVKEYNKMVAKLGESAEALAKSEREGAWREMARQVAHEIKNPLTPMKLSIQYLQKAINNNQENVKELSSNVARTLVEQIDHLSKIAADFSQFANIGNMYVVLFDLHEVMMSLKDLYQSDDRIELNWQALPGPLMVRADKTQMNRLFTNLFTNAVQACRDGRHCIINIGERKVGDHVIITIRDNGEGIPEAMRDKIFVPNFTTKSSGTGLGLAMCKSIVEQAKGKIWFETEVGRGTTFYVELPLEIE
jgi:two-component system nitrogen regulation sensor histidine kinase NtrY